MTRTWLIGGGIALALLLVASLVLGLTQTEKALTEGTPERAVQRYLTAVREEEFQSAHSLLSEALRKECAIDDFAGRSVGGKPELANSRVTLKNTRSVDGSAIVTVRVTTIRGSGPFGTSESSREQRFTLAQEEGEWRFTHYPWPYFGCGRPYYPRPAEPAPKPTPEPRATPTPEATSP